MKTLSIAIMAHPKRFERAMELRNKIDAQFNTPTAWLVIDEMNGNEWDNGAKAIGVPTNHSDYHIVIQDDAIISYNFIQNVRNAIENVPKRSLISFYTGQVRPFAKQVEWAKHKADTLGASWLDSRTLHWGVCIAIPTEDIASLLKYAQNQKLPYDRRIGQYYLQRGRRVYYTNPSIVDHDDTMPSLIGNDHDGPLRKAHEYHSGIIQDWNKDSVKVT